MPQQWPKLIMAVILLMSGLALWEWFWSDRPEADRAGMYWCSRDGKTTWPPRNDDLCHAEDEAIFGRKNWHLENCHSLGMAVVRMFDDKWAASQWKSGYRFVLESGWDVPADMLRDIGAKNGQRGELLFCATE